MQQRKQSSQRPRLTKKVLRALQDASMLCRATADAIGEGEEDEKERRENLYVAADYLRRLSQWGKR